MIREYTNSLNTEIAFIEKQVKGIRESEKTEMKDTWLNVLEDYLTRKHCIRLSNLKAEATELEYLTGALEETRSQLVSHYNKALALLKA